MRAYCTRPSLTSTSWHRKDQNALRFRSAARTRHAARGRYRVGTHPLPGERRPPASTLVRVEPMTGIEPAYSAWEVISGPNARSLKCWSAVGRLKQKPTVSRDLARPAPSSGTAWVWLRFGPVRGIDGVSGGAANRGAYLLRCQGVARICECGQCRETRHSLVAGSSPNALEENLGGCANWGAAFCAQTKALKPVMSRPTKRVWIVSVPS